MRETYIPGSETWVYEKKGKIMGFISMMGNEIGGLFVDPDYQSKGIGTQLVDFVREFHKTLEVEVFEDNVIGRPFYDSYGFKVLKKFVHSETNQILIRMTLSKNELKNN